MLQLTQSSILMHQQAANKAEALFLVANLMQEQGLATGFLPFLLGREAIASTYLGAGLAIPHGTPEAKNSVKQTGVAVVHFQDGVDWGDGNVVYVAVGICAKSDEHLTILRQIARLLGDDDLADKFKNAQTADALIALLSGQEAVSESPKPTADEPKKLAEKPVTEFGLTGATSDELLEVAYGLLLNRGAVDEKFWNAIARATWLKLKDGIWFVQASAGVKSFTQVMVGRGEYEGEKVNGLIVMARPNNVPFEMLDEFLDELVAMEFDELSQTALTGETLLPNEHGLHARPATFLANLCKEYQGEILIGLDNQNFVSAKSLSKLLSLGAECGQTLYIQVKGDDAQAWLDKVLQAVASGLGETVKAVPAKPPVLPDLDIEIELDLGEKSAILSKNTAHKAQVACKGIGIGKAFVAKKTKFVYERLSAEPQSEKKLFVFALNKAKDNLNASIANAKKPAIAEIFTAHLAMLDDDELLVGVHNRIDKGLSACGAFDEEIQHLATQQASLANPTLAMRANDWYDVGEQVLGVLCGTTPATMPDEPFVLVKADLLPSDVANLDEKVLAILTAQGGVTSHSAIIARSLGIPMLVGAGECVLDIAQGEQVLVNGETGEFVVSPDEGLVAQTLTAQADFAKKLANAKANADKPATTKDGRSMEVAVNLGDVDNVATAVQAGAEGVGLLRTEFVFMKHSRMPDKETQIIDYKKVFDEMGERPVVVRTLDVGGDKPLPYLPMDKEENPFLGVRGIRLSLANPDTLRTQLTALIQASLASSGSPDKHKPLRIMFPMVGQIAELKQARTILDEVLKDNPHNNLQVGIMVEVPSVAILADKFAPFVDFFSIGTNDLTQYTLAIDRGHPALSDKADGLDPSVLRFIELTVRAGQAFGKWVGVCGELASDSLAVPILLGLGVDELSVSASQIPLVKAQIRELNFNECQRLADKALIAESGQAVRAIVKESGIYC